MAAPRLTTAHALEVMELSEGAEGMAPSSGEPSESGELPTAELSMEQRAEVRLGKRAREPAATAAVLLDPTWGVCRLKEELITRGLCTSGLKRDLVVRLAAAMVDEGGGEREEARSRICMRER